MKLRDLSIAMAVLAALLAFLYWSNHHKPKEEETVKASAETSPKIFSLDQGNITGIRIERKDQPELDVSRNESGKWQITAPKPLPADQDSVSSLLSTLSSLSSERLLEEKAGDLAGYGLNHPVLTVDVKLKDNQAQKLLVGDQTPAGNSYYAMLSGDPRLFTLAGYNKTSLDKSANDLRDKRLLTANFDKVSQIALRNQKQKQDITFAREKDAWQILKPKPYRADSYQVDDLVRALREARFESGDGDDTKLAAAFKAAEPVAVAKVAGASGTEELEVRKEKDNYLAKSSVVTGIYKVPGSLATSLDKKLEDFQNKKVFDFGYQDPNKVEIHNAAKAYFLTRSGTDWWGAEGKKMDESSVEDVLARLRDLTAEKFPDSGFTSPVMEVTVTWQDGKRVDKVSLAKSGDNYVAKRENEPELYEVSGSSVSSLEKATEGLKTAAPSKK